MSFLVSLEFKLKRLYRVMRLYHLRERVDPGLKPCRLSVWPTR